MPAGSATETCASGNVRAQGAGKQQPPSLGVSREALSALLVISLHSTRSRSWHMSTSSWHAHTVTAGAAVIAAGTERAGKLIYYDELGHVDEDLLTPCNTVQLVWQICIGRS